MKISLPSADQPLTRHNKTKSILSKNTQSRDHKISSEDVNTGKHELAELMNQNRASSTWTHRRRSVRMRRRRTTVATKHRERTSSAPQRPPKNGDETDRMNHRRKANDQIHERSRSSNRWWTSEEHERDLTKDEPDLTVKNQRHEPHQKMRVTFENANHTHWSET